MNLILTHYITTHNNSTFTLTHSPHTNATATKPPRTARHRMHHPTHRASPNASHVTMRQYAATTNFDTRTTARTNSHTRTQPTTHHTTAHTIARLTRCVYYARAPPTTPKHILLFFFFLTPSTSHVIDYFTEIKQVFPSPSPSLSLPSPSENKNLK
jgi:hypothetical protein